MTACGQLVEAMLTAGNIHDVTVAESMFEHVYNCHCVLDMGYDSDKFRNFLCSQNNVPVIPGRRNRKQAIAYDKQLYALRKRIEMFFGRIKENKRIATRFDQQDSTYGAFIALAAIKDCCNIKLC